MIWAAAFLLVMGFLALLFAFGVPDRAKAAIDRSRQALAVVRDKQLSDLEKEKAMQEHAKRMFGLFATITLTSALALAIPVGIVALLDYAQVLDMQTVLDRTLSWQVLVAATVIGLAAFAVRRPESP